MKLLIDFNNLIYASFFTNLNINFEETKSDENFIRYLFLNKFLFIKDKFQVKGNDIFICIDGVDGWRKKVFPYYKANRKKTRDKSDIDYSLLFSTVAKFKDELKIFPYVVLYNDNLEADDWIGVASKHFENEDIIIVSTDRDFYQLQENKKVLQYNHIKNEIIRVDNASTNKIIKILSGDVGDGIPNILSDDDVLVTEGKRQKPMGEKKIGKLIDENKLDDFIKENERNYKRNKLLIDLSCIPENISTYIVRTINNYTIYSSKIAVISYLKEKNMKSLLGKVNNFF